ncbi:MULTISPECIES: hypothetical protein [Nonomuraea]|uniref:DivIVA domain-containing protein n=1 Tax=Nonomuraea ferruginea TaxID=46174 RepID=A0ABT4SVZ5_9ACTN|nr:hypothetical protein [Nonomuraea ferruginea]MDA0641412.1 hypothetical protein [Nonomuraea ferruginea]
MLLVILAIAALAILAGVVLVSLGKGGELTEFPPDVPPLNLPEAGNLAAVDVLALQLPVNLIGYHTQSVDESLRRMANAISARDTRIAILEQRVSELLSSRLYARQEVYAAPGNGPRTEHEPPASPLALTAESGPPSNGHVPPSALEAPAGVEHEPVSWVGPDGQDLAASSEHDEPEDLETGESSAERDGSEPSEAEQGPVERDEQERFETAQSAAEGSERGDRRRSSEGSGDVGELVRVSGDKDGDDKARDEDGGKEGDGRA